MPLTTIGTDAIDALAVTNAKLAGDAVTTAKIAAGAVGTTDIADNAVDGAKIAMTSDAQGDILFYGGSDYERLSVGTTGQFLKTQGASQDPIWATVTLTTINTNADNRIVTGSGTADTLNAEANFTYDGTTLGVKNGGTASDIKVYCETANTHYTSIKSAAHAAYTGGSWTLTLPGTDGAADEFLKTNGSGVTSWAAVDALPTQTSKGGYTLITDGTDAAWAARSNRNIIINGNFNVWQRGTSFAAIANATYAPDRFFYEKTGAMVHTITRDADVPTQAQSGIKSLYSMKVDCTTVDASIAAGDFCNLVQRIEGYNYSQLEGNTGTISFWVKATKTGTYCVSVISGSSDRSYVSEYTVSVADTWEKKTATIVFNYSGGGWNYTDGIGLQMKWALATGSNYQGVADTWNSAQDSGTSNQVNACDSTSNNFFLSQVQLEVSPTATPFEHKSFVLELEACQRYYEKSYNTTDVPGVASLVSGFASTTNNAVILTQAPGATFKVTKRSNPTIVTYNAVTGASGKAYRVSDASNESITVSHVGQSAIGYINMSSSNNGFYYHYTADSEL